jgi:UDP-3-O-[3-hydroxymyristoyl] N-acetylglucosamine deacetylase
MQYRSQRTLQREISFSGIGIHTGKEVTMRFCPALEGSGITFQRVDLPSKPLIPATISHVSSTTRRTTLGKGETCVHTIEHVLSALNAYQIDNLCIQLTQEEPPGADGSALPFIQMIEEAGIRQQEAEKEIYPLLSPLYFSQGETHLIALPSEEFRVSYTLHYPNAPLIRSQFFSLAITEDNYKKEIAPCRTFALYEEIALLTQQGLIRGGSLENAVVIKGDLIFSKEGCLRFSDEMVRHKILDLIGDLALVGVAFLAHIIAIRSGHTTNIALGKKLMMQLTGTKG